MSAHNSVPCCIVITNDGFGPQTPLFSEIIHPELQEAGIAMAAVSLCSDYRSLFNDLPMLLAADLCLVNITDADPLTWTWIGMCTAAGIRLCVLAPHDDDADWMSRLGATYIQIPETPFPSDWALIRSKLAEVFTRVSTPGESAPPVPASLEQLRSTTRQANQAPEAHDEQQQVVHLENESPVMHNSASSEPEHEAAAATEPLILQSNSSAPTGFVASTPLGEALYIHERITLTNLALKGADRGLTIPELAKALRPSRLERCVGLALHGLGRRGYIQRRFSAKGEKQTTPEILLTKAGQAYVEVHPELLHTER